MSLDISNFENDLQPIELKAGKTRISFTILQTSEMQNAISNLSFNCSNLLDMRTSRNKLKTYSVAKNCSDLSLFE